MPIQPEIAVGGMGLFSLGLNNFYATKSVLPSWKFTVFITTDDDIIKTGDNAGKIIQKIIKRAFSRITYHHIVDVSIPLYKYQSEVTKYGPVAKTFPVLNHEGFQIKITFEDDSDGNVLKLIHEMQQTVVDSNGFYKPLNENKIGDININLFNHHGINVCQWIGKNAYFLGAEDISLSYKNDDTLKLAVNFGCDIISFRKHELIPSVVKNGLQIGAAIATNRQSVNTITDFRDQF